MSKEDKAKKITRPNKAGCEVRTGEVDGILPSELFRLYVARVGEIDIEHSIIDKRQLFAEALHEARVAYEVYANQVKGGLSVSTSNRPNGKTDVR